MVVYHPYGDKLKKGFRDLVTRCNARFNDFGLECKLNFDNINIGTDKCSANIIFRYAKIESFRDLRDRSPTLIIPVDYETLETPLFYNGNKPKKKKTVAEILRSLELETILIIIQRMFFVEPQYTGKDTKANQRRFDTYVERQERFISYLRRKANELAEQKDKINSLKDYTNRRNVVNMEVTSQTFLEENFEITHEVYNNKGLKRLVFYALQVMSGIDFGYPSLVEEE